MFSALRAAVPHALGAVGVTTLVAGTLPPSTVAAEPAKAETQFTFQRISYAKGGVTDTRFTQLLGINDYNQIAGYHGDEGTEMTPNQGFILQLPGQFTDENFPNSAQTQVVGINNLDDTVGLYIDQAGANHGFIKDKDKDAVTVDLPGTTFNQLLGVNDKGQAAGYFQDTATPPLQHAYVHEKNGDFRVLALPMQSSQATGINNDGTIVGFVQQSTADAHSSGFILRDGKLTQLNYPGATFTQALGINNSNEVVGQYMAANGDLHGFLYSDGKFRAIGVPGAAQTVVNGINRDGRVVGFFADAATGNTIGLVGERKR
jgi:probable HAF family extracellular repeat protein